MKKLKPNFDGFFKMFKDFDEVHQKMTRIMYKDFIENAKIGKKKMNLKPGIGAGPISSDRKRPYSGRMRELINFDDKHIDDELSVLRKDCLKAFTNNGFIGKIVFKEGGVEVDFSETLESDWKYHVGDVSLKDFFEFREYEEPSLIRGVVDKYGAVNLHNKQGELNKRNIWTLAFFFYEKDMEELKYRLDSYGNKDLDVLHNCGDLQYLKSNQLRLGHFGKKLVKVDSERNQIFLIELFKRYESDNENKCVSYGELADKLSETVGDEVADVYFHKLKSIKSDCIKYLKELVSSDVAKGMIILCKYEESKSAGNGYRLMPYIAD